MSILKLILLINILTANICLETKFILKSEKFFSDCNSNPFEVEFERLEYECKDE